jgi:glycerol-3-phosphate dehydrogenase
MIADEITPFDVIVIGAGINGAGVAHDAASRGLRVLLLDKGDIASGTTSASTRLVHGGLRYLEHREVGLVRESLHERETLLRLAPHLVRRIGMLIPLYEHARRHRLTIRAGLWVYDGLSAGTARPRHRFLSLEDTVAREPGLNREGLKGAALYADAQVDYPERLALENVLAATAHGAEVRTYTRVDQILVDGGSVRGVRYTDELTGASGQARADVVVNATGPWIDQLLGRSALSDGPLLGGTKGSHIVVDRFEGAPDVAIYAEAHGDNRPFFIEPWNGLILIGTTDSPYAGPPDDARATATEVEYLLAATTSLLPHAGLTAADVLYTWSGVRPLPYAPGADPSGITRRHFVHDHAPLADGLLTLVGGKITTYRRLAEIAVDEVVRRTGHKRSSATARTPLPGAAVPPSDVEDELVAAGPALAAAAPRLTRLYGSRSLDIARLARDHTELARPLTGDGRVLAAEIELCVHEERPANLRDVLLRRTMLGLDPRLTGRDMAAVARQVQVSAGWDDGRLDAEMRAFEAERNRSRITPAHEQAAS